MKGNNGDLIKTGPVRECICKEMAFQLKTEGRGGMGERILGRVKFGMFQELKESQQDWSSESEGKQGSQVALGKCKEIGSNQIFKNHATK